MTRHVTSTERTPDVPLHLRKQGASWRHRRSAMRRFDPKLPRRGWPLFQADVCTAKSLQHGKMTRCSLSCIAVDVDMKKHDEHKMNLVSWVPNQSAPQQATSQHRQHRLMPAAVRFPVSGQLPSQCQLLKSSIPGFACSEQLGKAKNRFRILPELRRTFAFPELRCMRFADTKGRAQVTKSRWLDHGTVPDITGHRP